MVALAKRERRQAARMGTLLRFDRQLWCQGLEHVAGVDEVGVGPLAGPVVAAAVILPQDIRIRGIDDSKSVARERREVLASALREQALAIGVGVVDAPQIDRINIYQATLLAMKTAVLNLQVKPDHVIVDARQIPDLDYPQTPVIKGDRRSYSVAAASIIAKVARDAMMAEYDRHYPGYGLGKNMGYGTRQHLEAIGRQGPTPIHRRSFAPLRQLRLPGL